MSENLPAKILGDLAPATLRRLEELCAESAVPEGRTPLVLRLASFADPVFQKSAVLSPDDLRLPDSLKTGFVEIADAIVTPLGFLIAGDRLAFDTQLLPQGWMRGGLGGSPELIRRLFERNSIHKLDLWRETCLLSLPADMVEIEAPAFLFSSRLSWCNLAHLIFDTLIQTPTFLDAAAEAGGALRPILVGPGFQYPIMPRLFAAAAAEAEPLFTRGRFYRVRRLFVPTTHFAPASEAIARGAVARLRRRLGGEFAEFRQPQKRRLLISRADSSRDASREPAFDNAEALERALAGLGFETLVASRLDVADYLAAFVNAEIVVGLHGAGLMNAVMSEAPRVLELTVPGYPDWHAIRLFLQTGMAAPYARLAMPPPEAGIAHYDVGSVVEACEALLATPCPMADLPL